MLTKEEFLQIQQYNSTDKPAIFSGTVPEAFQQIAEQIPGQNFIVFHPKDEKSNSLTYAEVDKASSQIANYLKPQIQKSNNVGICLSRSPKILQTFLGVLKAGGV